MLRLQEAIGVSSFHARVVCFDGAAVLFSYETPVALADDSGLYRTAKKWSATTARHINQWLGGVEATVIDQDALEARVERAIQAAYHTERRKAR